MEKLNVVVLFGGQSSEHEVSLVSATNVLGLLDPAKYNVSKVGITKEGNWLLYEGPVSAIKDGSWEQGPVIPAILSPDPTMGLVKLLPGGTDSIPVDVVFPVLHGKYGEDGTIQGFCELAKLPCVGPGMLASANCMDKTVTKILLKDLGIPQADWITIFSEELVDENLVLNKIESKFSYPVFIKPANAGSSVGIGKSHDRSELAQHLKEAARHDRKILVEEFIHGREVECAVLGNLEPTASILGEIIPDKEFYDYEAKYESDSELILPAPLPAQTTSQIQSYAKKAFVGMDLRGMARVDFFVHKETGQVYLNEINTIPGFTDISMYPRLMGQSGYPGSQLADRLIALALESFAGMMEQGEL